MSLSDAPILPVPSHPEPQVMRWSGLEYRAIYEYARAIERAATIEAMRRCAEICSVRADEFPYWNDAAGECATAIRAEIARLEAEK